MYKKTAIVLLPHAARLHSGSTHFVEQFGMMVKQPQQLDERQRRTGFAVLITRKGIDAAAKNFRRLPLIQGETQLPKENSLPRFVHLAKVKAEPLA